MKDNPKDLVYLEGIFVVYACVSFSLPIVQKALTKKISKSLRLFFYFFYFLISRIFSRRALTSQLSALIPSLKPKLR